MKLGRINGRWDMILPDQIADWDAITGCWEDRQGWEFCRFESFDRHLERGMTLYDVGAEHGWISAVLAREYVGPENMVLFEPSSEFWANIRLTWEANGLALPLVTCEAFVADAASGVPVVTSRGWPESAASDIECPAMAYRALGTHLDVPATTIDDVVASGIAPPDAINIDVEGAEWLVLRGAEQTLLTHRPLVWVSVHPDLMEGFGHTPEDLYAWMFEVGYGRQYLGTDHEQHHLFAPLEWIEGVQ